MGREEIPTKTVSSIAELLSAVSENAHEWEPAFPWFRGEDADTPTPLTPLVFRTPRREYNFDRSELTGYQYDENNLLQSFRRRAHLMGLPIIPQREETDLWLFLARHVGLPTGLLDWSEGALIGLYFALFEKRPVVWMLNPYELNRKSAPGPFPNVFPLTWFPGEGERNIGFKNVQAAWRLGDGATELPVAIEPTNIHPRMNAQHSYFTVHGQSREALCDLVDGGCLRRYLVNLQDRDQAMRDLRRLGIAQSTIMPDAEALSAELRRFLVTQSN
jgi:hypothetical protein